MSLSQRRSKKKEMDTIKLRFSYAHMYITSFTAIRNLFNNLYAKGNINFYFDEPELEIIFFSQIVR